MLKARMDTIAQMGKKAKFFLAKAHNAYQTVSRQGQKSRLDQSLTYKTTTTPYLQHYISCYNDWVPFISFYPRNDIILDDINGTMPSDCYHIDQGKVLMIPSSNNPNRKSNVARISATTDVASACLVTQSENVAKGYLDVLHICQRLQANINPLLATMSLAELMPYFNFILEDNFTFHVPLHLFRLSIEFFDEEDDTQHVTFGPNDTVFCQ